MNWNFSAGRFSLRMPITEQDSEPLFNLLKEQSVNDHIPRVAQSLSVQAFDELRRIAMRFESREAAFWLVENEEGQLIARISVQRINWMLRSAQIQWELSGAVTLVDVKEFVPAVMKFCFNELGLHRLEMRLRGNEMHNALLAGLGFSHEGYLPEQLEYNNEAIDLDVWSYLATDR